MLSNNYHGDYSMKTLSKKEILEIFNERLSLAKSNTPEFYISPGLVVTDPDTRYKYTCIGLEDGEGAEGSGKIVVLLTYDASGKPAVERMHINDFVKTFEKKKSDNKNKKGKIHGKK